MRLRDGKRQIASLLLPLLAVALIAASAAFGAYALIPMLLALLLLSVLRNGMLSFSTALFISCIVFGSVDDFFRLLLKQIDYAVLAILMVGGLLGVVYREGGADFYIWLRRKARSFRLRKLLAALVALINFFSSTTSVIATNLMLREDLRSEHLEEADRKDLLRIVLLLCNVSCALVPLSLWWLFFGKFRAEVPFSFSTVLPFLFYPAIVMVYTFATAVRHEEREGSEMVLEKRLPDAKNMLFLFFIPLIFTYSVLFFEGACIYAGVHPLFTEKTLVLGSFTLGTLLTLVVYVTKYAMSPEIDAGLWRAVENIDESRRIVERAVKDAEGGRRVYVAGGRVLSVSFLRSVLSRLTTGTELEDTLSEAKYFHVTEPGPGPLARLRTSLTDASLNLFEGVSRFAEQFLSGMKEVFGAVLIFVFALGIKDLAIEMGLPSVAVGGPLWLMPALTLVVSASIGYFLGTAWGTFAICFTLLILPLEGTVPTSLLNLSIAALISSSVFVNQVSSVADNVILTSALSGLPIEEVAASVRKDAFMCFVISMAMYLLMGALASGG